jgi:CDP-glycerol glycerophosphotransferase (TagB/SpsB family)
MDRIHDADDNGERLFEHLRRERPDINAWFVLRPGTPDWDRLTARGQPRLVAEGGFQWRMLMLNAAWLVSSHTNDPLINPPALRRLVAKPTWRYAFLQHGVMKDDLSPWFNRRHIDMLVVSTEQEFASVVADGTGYHLTAKETRNTGLPRFDRLLTLGHAVPEEDRDLVLIAPTWRVWFTLPPASGDMERAVREEFWDSEYLRRWKAILASPEIAAAVRERGWRIAFMPHPNLQDALPRVDLPAHVEALGFAGNDVQGLYARCALLVTDYSSVSFNTAYLDRPVVYYQFDREVVEGGRHLGRRGYFDYGRDGYGPVALEHATAVAAVVDAIRHGPLPTPEYQARIDLAFPLRDGRACERVIDAIEELGRPWQPGTGGGARHP